MTFSQRLAAGFGLVVLLAVTVTVVAIYALRDVVARKDVVIDVTAQRLIDAERLRGFSLKKAVLARAFMMTRDPKYLEQLQGNRLQLRAMIEKLRGEVETNEGRQLVQDIDRTEEANQRALEKLVTLRSATNLPVEEIGARFDREVVPLREQLDGLVDKFGMREERLLKEGRQAATDAANDAIRLTLVLLAIGIALAAALSLFLARTLSRQILKAVGHVQSSSTELQAAAGQQASGAQQQATAMMEITTTINELLASSRQIAESAQRVASTASETATAARTGDQTMQRTQDAVGGISRQVGLIVNHMLDLGGKSQQIGGIVEIINELSEQTNILAINATIEAAGAGEAGRRFAVVAEEIRKLADRVGGSTKDIRTLIDEVRAAVNTSLMATEGGSKAVDAGVRQFSEVAVAFAQIARLASTTTEAAREIELSTKQQASAVEQVNLAVGEVAQGTREAESSAGQALLTVSQLAAMSRDLVRLVQPAMQTKVAL
jgi:methyl-accepting chemotaxis protein